MVIRRRNMKGGSENEGATFMNEHYFMNTAPSTNAEMVTSGNGSNPPMMEHNLITGIPLKAAPGAKTLMGGRQRRNMRGGDNNKNNIVAEIAEALKELSIDDLMDIKSAIMNSNQMNANQVANAAMNVANAAPMNTSIMNVAMNAQNAATVANAATTIPEAMEATNNASMNAANAAVMAAPANTDALNAVKAANEGNVEKVVKNVNQVANAMTGGKRRRNKKVNKKN